VEGPRPIQPEEYEATMRLVNAVFHSPHGMAQALPLMFGPANQHHLWVVIEDGQPVSHIGLTVKPAVLGGVQVLVAGLGAVGTHPEYRGRGYASLLLQAVFDQAEREGADLAMISGGRGLYRRVGCAKLGRVHPGAFSSSELLGPAVAVKPYQGDAAPFATLAAGEPVRWMRDRADWELLLGQNPLARYRWIRCYVEAEGQPVAYVVLKHYQESGKAFFTEWAGDRLAALGAVRRIGEERGISQVMAGVAHHDQQMLAALFGEAVPAAQGDGMTAKVLNLPRLLEKLPGRPAGLACGGDRERWVLRLGEEELVLEGEAPCWLVWGQVEAEGDYLPPPGPLRTALQQLFPLPRLCYGLNYV